MRTFGRVLLVVLVIGAIGALGFGVWNAGYQQGLVETVGSTTDVVVTAPFYPAFWGFGFFGLVFKLFVAILLFGLIAKLFFGRRYWRSHHMSGGPEHYRSRMEERLSDWHDQAHGRAPPPEPDSS